MQVVPVESGPEPSLLEKTVPGMRELDGDSPRGAGIRDGGRDSSVPCTQVSQSSHLIGEFGEGDRKAPAKCRDSEEFAGKMDDGQDRALNPYGPDKIAPELDYVCAECLKASGFKVLLDGV